MTLDRSHADLDLDRRRLIAIIESSDDAIVSKDLEGVIRTWNPAAERIFGYTPDEIIGQPIFRLIPPELHDEEHQLLARIRRGEHIAHYDTDRIRKDGRRIRIALTLSPLRDRDGNLIGASAIKRDVTAQRAIELQLQQAQRMEAVGRLAGGIAHDFNNLLTIIGGLTRLAVNRLAEGSRERTDLEQVIKAADRATTLTQQLLTFSRRQVAEIAILDVADVVRGLESLLRRLIGEHIALRTILTADSGRVRSNRAQLEQVVMNLVVNARDAMPEGGSLVIQVDIAKIDAAFAQERLRLDPGEYVVLSVSDTGEGMDALTQANIFEPFFTTKAPGTGTGLGLATVYAIVQQTGGAIYVYSEPGRGSTFKVYLPREDAAVPRAADTAEHSPTPAHTRGTILIAEDEPGVRAFSASVLEDAGYQVLEAGSGEEALALAAAPGQEITLLLTDVVMPGINGRVLAERVRALFPRVAVIYTSGYTDDMVLRAGVLTESAAFLQKPFTPERLLRRVGTAIAAASAS
ncbi:MAG TPA: PAS domain S-box protein [Gemmatimonadales bacterium]|nr:PAS domain S-box protein [Gemmatimonadales bacterium]